MKKIMIALILLIVLTFSTLFSIPSAVAAPLKTEQGIEVFQPDEGKTVAVGKDLYTFKKFVNKDTATAVSLIQITHAPEYKGAFLLEKHTVKTPENFYVLQGEFEFFSSQPDEKMKVTAGDIVYVPAEIPHGYKHVGTGIGKMLVVLTNTGFQDLLEEIGTPVAEQSSIPSSDVPPDFKKIASAARKYGIEFLN